MKTPAYRYLRGYTLDPGFSTLLDTYKINQTIYRINWEEVSPGPTGEYLEVVDVDPASGCFYEPIDLNLPEVMVNQGLNPSEGNPQFHQQFVFTIGMVTIENFEKALGRKVIWRPPTDKEDAAKKSLWPLRVYPHGIRQANAYYSPSKKAILFGYFKAGENTQGANFPGGTVFTCLSPDIIAHEMTHAILDSIHPRFRENTNTDVAAFHEGFADVIALLQRFSTIDLIEHELERTKGRLDQQTVFGSLASQMGQALSSGHGALREAIGYYDEEGKWVRRKPDPKIFRNTYQPHSRGALFVAAIFDAFIDLYTYNTKDLFRIARTLSGSEASISVDLVKRLAQEAATIAKNLLQICIQALDYVPPFDISFGDYLRALVTADLEMAPADDFGYRVSLIQSFRAWGIYPDQVNTLSIESLQWDPISDMSDGEKEVLSGLKEEIRPHVRALLALKDRGDIYYQSMEVRAVLEAALVEKMPSSLRKRYEVKENPARAWDQFMARLGLTTKEISFTHKGKKIEFEDPLPKIEVHSLRPVSRFSREGRHIEQLIVTLTQTYRVRTKKYKGFTFRGGSTIILNLEEEGIEYLIYKNIRSNRRFSRQLSFALGEIPGKQAQKSFVYEEENLFGDVEFQHLHDFNL